MGYREHTIQRLNERFTTKDGVGGFSDNDYDLLSEILRDDSNCLKIIPQKHRSAHARIVFYRGILMYCIVSNKKKILKTVLPVKRNILIRSFQ